MRVHVAFTPAEAEQVPTAVVVDVLRATSTIAQALAAGYRRVLCCAEIEEARALRAELGEGVLAGERRAVGDRGLRPRQLAARVPRAARRRRSILTTTNGTRAIVAAAANADDGARSGASSTSRPWREAAAPAGRDVEVVCAGVEGSFTLDDAYCAGRIVELLGASGATRPRRPCGSRVRSPTALAGLRASENPFHEKLGEDVDWCARRACSRSSLGSPA